MALTLAAVGLDGVMAYLVTAQTKEIGLRIAIGARPSQILSEIFKSGGTLTGAGILIGTVVAAAASSLAGSLLYGVGPFDTTAYLIAIGALVTVALVACLFQAGGQRLLIPPARCGSSRAPADPSGSEIVIYPESKTALIAREVPADLVSPTNGARNAMGFVLRQAGRGHQFTCERQRSRTPPV